MGTSTGWMARALWTVVCAGMAVCAGLAGQEYAPRVDFGARLEPKGVLLHGAGQDPEAFRRYAEAVGTEKRPLLSMHYFGLKDLKANWAEELRRQLLADPESFVIPQIGLSMTRDGKPDESYEDQVAAGEMDEQIGHLAAGLRSLTVPVYLRIGYEFNGKSWNGYEPEGYKAAFQRIVEQLRGSGAEVATVWCAAMDGTRNFEDFYPGDEYVDWFGIDIFSARHFQDEDLRRFVADAAARRKPVMLGESTPRRIGAQKAEAWEEWFAPFFEWLRQTPEVKQFHYINWAWGEKSMALNQPGWADWEDARLETEAAEPVRTKYVEALGSPVVQHATGESEFRRSLGLEELAQPVAPLGLAVTEGTVGGVGLRWEAPDGEIGVEVARYYGSRDGALSGFAASPEALDEAAKAGETVEYRVAVMTRAGTLSEWSDPLQVEMKELLRASDGFSEATPGAWQLDRFHADALAGLTLEEGAARIGVDGVSGTGWHIQFRRFVWLHEGLRYRIRVRAKADRVATARLWLQQAAAPNTIYANRALDLETEWKELAFEVKAAATGRTSLALILGGLPAGSAVWVDEVEVKELAPE